MVDASARRYAPKPRTRSTRRRPTRPPSTVYSALVRMMRVVLPVTAIVLLALVALWPQFNELKTLRPTLPIAASLEMVEAKYEGRDELNRPFTVTAERAAHATDRPDVVQLDQPMADIVMEDSSWLALSAQYGLYNESTQVIDLEGAVNIFHDLGYEVTTEKARVDIDKGMAWGDVPVIGHGPIGQIEAEGFRLTDRGDRVVFLGTARLRLEPDALSEAQPAP